MSDVIGCARIEGDQIVVPGSEKRTCDDCGHPIWLAPTGQRIVAEKGATPICVECILERMRNDPEPETVPISAEQRIEAVLAMMAHRRRN